MVVLSAYEMFLLYKYLVVSLFFSRHGFWSGNLFLIVPIPDSCLLVPFYHYYKVKKFRKFFEHIIENSR